MYVPVLPKKFIKVWQIQSNTKQKGIFRSLPLRVKDPGTKRKSKIEMSVWWKYNFDWNGERNFLTWMIGYNTTIEILADFTSVGSNFLVSNLNLKYVSYILMLCTSGLFFQHFSLNSRQNKLKDLAKLKDFSLNSSIFLPKLGDS